MKLLKGFLAFLLAVTPLIALNPDKASAHENLVPNPSVETSVAGENRPEFWHQGSNWGSRSTVFSYENTGLQGNRSLKVMTTNYQSGDAKWYFDHVAVQPNTGYTYSDYYKSDVGTELVAEVLDATGAVSYQWLAWTGPSSDWKQVSIDFTTTANTAKISIFHLLIGNGYLQTDAFSLTDQHAPGGNILNPGFETADPNNPAQPFAWKTGSWGTNTPTYSYQSTGYVSERSGRVDITNYQSGDAKWYFEPIAVEPNTDYLFENYYRANILTSVVAQVEADSGAISYQWLGDVAASANWKQTSLPITTPANAERLTIFHLLAGNGFLETDSYSFAENLQGLVPNPSFETADAGNPNAPAQWQANNWGSNTAAFEYLNEGHTGNRSAKVTVSNYQSGDAKWWYEPVVVEPGIEYAFSNFYRANIPTRIVVWVVTDAGTNQYIGLGSAPASANWIEFHDTFTMPVNAARATILHIVEQNGFLIVDDYALALGQIQGFDRALVTLTFDDGWEANVATALPIMQQHGFLSTQFYATGFLDGENYQNLQNVWQFINAGHEIGSHSVTHPDLTTLSPEQLDYELRESKQFLENTFGVKVKNFASPFGAYNNTVIEGIQQYYQSHRGVDVGYNSKDNFDIWRFKVQNMTPATTLAEVQAWLQHAASKKLWLILVYHKVEDVNVGPYDTTEEQFIAQMAALAASGIHVATMQQAIEELLPQL
ncbi:MAG: polysaccharide deacetylase family protein [Patescibacteria group bacterium]